MNGQIHVKVGQVIDNALITKVLSRDGGVPYGVLVEVAKDGEGDKAKPVCGLLHVSEILGRERTDREAALAGMKEGQEVTVKVTKIELPPEQAAAQSVEGEAKVAKPADKVKISLSQRAAQRDRTLSQLAKGSIVTGTVVSKKDGLGVFVALGQCLDGLVHVSQLTGNTQDERQATFESIVEGQQLEVEVVRIGCDDKGNTRVGLSLKSIERRKVIEGLQNQVGQQVIGVVTSVVDYGAFVQVGVGVDGLLHVSAMSGDTQDDRNSRRDSLNKGDQLEVVIDSVVEEADGKVRIALSE